MGKEELLDKLAKTIIDGDTKAATEVAQEILSAGIEPTEAMLKGATKGLDILGESFQDCYDLKILKPTPEWLDIYLKVKRELIELGIPLEYP